MSDTKWTPGPWLIGRYHHVVLPNFDLPKSEGGGEGICHVYGDTDKRVANARLIAAAPKLYKALAAAESALVSIGAQLGEDFVEELPMEFLKRWEEVEESARAALAEAEGK